MPRIRGWGFLFDRIVPYAEGVRIQAALQEARLADRIPDTVLILQHAPVVTLGRRGRTAHLLLTGEALRERGIDLHPSGRGGDVTYHGPGQWVVYPILRLGDAEADAHGYLHNLEEISIRACRDFGVDAWRRPGLSGAWTSAGKIAAIGFLLKRWITMHGTSFNADPDLEGFRTIVPCGLAGEPVASLRSLLADRCPPLPVVRDRLSAHCSEVLCREFQWFPEHEHWPEPVEPFRPGLSRQDVASAGAGCSTTT